MAILFYIIGWLTILGGAAWSGYAIYSGVSSAEGASDVLGFLAREGISQGLPGLWAAFSGFLLLAIGGVLSRLDEIAYNTRPLD